MPELPDKPFEDWTLDEVEALAAGEPEDSMPGSGRKVPGPATQLVNEMRAAGAATVAEVDPSLRDRVVRPLGLKYGKLTPDKIAGGMQGPNLSKAKKPASDT